jgi:hypothetical protein
VFACDQTYGRIGHIFYTNLQEYAEIKYYHFLYYIWRVKFIEDPNWIGDGQSFQCLWYFAIYFIIYQILFYVNMISD